MCAYSLNASADPAFAWSKIVDSPEANEQNGGITVTADGNFVSFNSFQTSGTDSPCYFGSEVVANGSTTSGNRNLLVLKNDSEGNKLWAVYSKEGYIDASAGGITPTPDGGVIALVKTRPTYGSPYKAAVLVDASGDETEIYDMNTSIWGYTQAIIKISASGNIEWARIVLMDQLPVPAATTTAGKVATTDAVTPSSVCTDSDGNIFIAGNYRAPMVVSGQNNSCFVLTARNIATYNGDPQQTAGGLYLIKLDAAGNYLGHIKPSGDNNYEKINSLAYVNGNIVFNGNAKGNGDTSSLSIGTHSFDMAANTLDGLFVGSVKASDLSCNYLRRYTTFANSKNAFVLQVKNMIAADGKVYVCGAINGGIGDTDASSAIIATEGTMLEAFALQIDAADGSILRAYREPGTAITGYFGAFAYGDDVYFQGYTIMKNAFIDRFPAAAEWTDNSRFNFMTGTIGMAAGAAINQAGIALVSTRVNGEVVLSGTDTKPKTTGYGTVLTSYNFGSTVGISDISAPAGNISFAGENGAIAVTADCDSDVTVYNLEGIVVASEHVSQGTTRISLPQGIYIANGTKIAVK